MISGKALILLQIILQHSNLCGSSLIVYVLILSTLVLQNYITNKILLVFLKGLKKHFFVVHFQILLMDPLPPVNRVFSMIIQLKRHNSSSPIIDEPNTFVNVGQSSNGKGRGGGAPTR
ncbi:hypothetical protein Fmac_001854 [Flemingia macrophylla]|uniref:Uncharacterized protein n=1 Tax=Flemingia macrophylla TaxID=520843 RepID=A0ABD1NIA4_9FABA